LAVVEGRGKLAVQRKAFPDDLLASLDDGRLARELPLLAQTEYPVLMVEGRPAWTADGHLMQSWNSRWTRLQIRNLLRSVWLHGVAVEWTESLDDTAAAIVELDSWFRKDIHRSLLSRSKSHAKDSWGIAGNREWARFFLQGLPGIGLTLAESLYDHFGGRVPLKWDCDLDELKQVEGIGDKRARMIWEALQT